MRTLRAVMTTSTVALTFMVLVASGAIVLLTSYLHETSSTLRDGVTSMRLAHEAELNLVEVAPEPGSVTDAPSGVAALRILDDARQHATSPEQRHAVDEASRSVERYLTVGRDAKASPEDVNATLGVARHALGALVRTTRAEANRAAVRAEWLDQVSNVVGVAVGLLMLLTVGGLYFWLRRTLLRPMLDLSNSIARFSEGASDTRAPERGLREVHDMAQRFNVLASTLARQHKVRATFLAGVAHDLRNPLGALQLSVALVDPSQPLPREERVRDTLVLVRRQIARLNRMVNDLLDTARIEAGNLSLSTREEDLRNIVADAANLFEGTSPLHEIRVSVPPEPVNVVCDPERIEQTLNNLISNAIKYSPRGGAVTIAVRDDGEHAIIAVSDGGVGIAEPDVQHLFEAFRRPSAAAELAPGTGLGLSVAKRIVDAHDGEIRVESAVGIGSTFSVYLPRASQTTTSAPEQRPHRVGLLPVPS